MSFLNIFAVVWGTLEILLFAGQIFGWSSLVYVFKNEGYFEDLCGDVAINKNTSFVTDPAAAPASVDIFPLASSPSILSTRVTAAISDKTTPILLHSQPRNAVYGSSNNYSYGPGVDANHRRSHTVNVNDNDNGCAAADEQFNLIYTLAVVFAGVTVLFTGYLMDRLGTRVCRCIGIVCYVTAVLLVAFSTKGTAIILLPAMMLVTYGGYVFVVTNMQLGNLIPQSKSTIISLYCGAYDSSAFTMVLVKLAYEAGVPVKSSFLFIACLFTMVIASTFWFMPRRHIPFPPPENYHLNFSCRKTPPPPLEEEVGREETTDKKDSSSSSPVDGQSFKTIAASSLYLLDILWLTCHRFQSWSFVGRLNATLNRLANNDKDTVSRYLSVYASMQFLGIFLAPLSGRLMDRRSRADAPPQIKKIERLEVCTASFLIDTTLGLLLAVVVSLPVLELQYVAFLLHVVHRALLYGPNSAFIAQVYGPQHFGKLFGLAMSCSAAFSMLQYPLFVLVRGPLEGDPFVFNIVVLVLMVVSFVHPVYIWRRCRADRRAFNAEVAAAEPLNQAQAEVNL